MVTPPPVTDILAQFVSTTELPTMSDKTLANAKMHILDTLGVALATGYSFEYRAFVIPQIIWGIVAWIGVSSLALGRVLRGWQARRAALMSAVTFASVVALYVVFRLASLNRGQFL